jgi:WD40 repeat protein
LAAIGENKTIKLWDISSGKLLYTLVGHSDLVLALDFSPDGRLLATSSADRTAKVWDVQTGKLLQTLVGFSDWVYPVVFSPDGKYLAASGKILQTLSSHTGKEVIVWERTPGLENPTILNPFTRAFAFENEDIWDVMSIVFSPTGKYLAIGSFNIIVYDISTATSASPPKSVLFIPAHENAINGMFYSPDGTRLVSGSADGTAKVWDTGTGQLLLTLPGNTGPVSSIAHTPDGLTLFTAYYNGQVKIWDLSQYSNKEWLIVPYLFLWFKAGTGDRIAGWAADTSLIEIVGLSPAGTSKITSFPLGHDINSVAFDINQELTRLAVVYFGDDIVHVWDLSTRQETNSFSIEKTATQNGYTQNDYFSIILSPGSTRLVTAGLGGAAFEWDVQTGKLLHELSGQTGSFTGFDSIAFSRDGSLIACANDDGTVRVWDANSGALIHNLPGSTNASFTQVSFSPDGRRLLATGKGTALNLWDLKTGQLFKKIPVPTAVIDLGFSPDGKYMATVTIDGVVRLWDANTGQQLINIPGGYSQFTSDGKHMLTLMDMQYLYGYTLDVQELMDLARTRLTRTWTQEECEQFLHTEVCPPTP